MKAISFLLIVVFAATGAFFTPYVIEGYTNAHKQTKKEIHPYSEQHSRPKGTIRNQ